MAFGRPTKYDPAYCEMLVAHMRTGLSFPSFAGKLEINPDTLYEWLKKHPDFSEAKRVGEALNLQFWEGQGIQGLWGNKELSFNSTVWVFNMKNRHRWRDKQPEEVANVNVTNLGNLTHEELLEKAKEAIKVLEKK